MSVCVLLSHGPEATLVLLINNNTQLKGIPRVKEQKEAFHSHKQPVANSETDSKKRYTHTSVD